MKGVKIGYYKKEDWDLFINMVDDKENLHSSWDEWNNAFNKLKFDLKRQGIDVLQITIDLEELKKYCLINDLKNTSSTRSQFIQQS